MHTWGNSQMVTPIRKKKDPLEVYRRNIYIYIYIAVLLKALSALKRKAQARA